MKKISIKGKIKSIFPIAKINDKKKLVIVFEQMINSKNLSIQMCLWDSDVEKFIKTEPKLFTDYLITNVNIKQIKSNDMPYNKGSSIFQIQSTNSTQFIQREQSIEEIEYLKIERLVSEKVFSMINIKGVVIEVQNIQYEKCRKREITLGQKCNRVKIDFWNEMIDSIMIEKGDKVYMHNLQVKEFANRIYLNYHQFSECKKLI